MTRAMPNWITVLAAVILLICADQTSAESLPRVPEGFTIEKVAGPPLVQYPMMAGFDDRGRLFVAASAGQNIRANDLMKDPPNFVRMLQDTNGDGRFDKSTIFADKMTLPMGALWYRGGLYVASPPSIWRLEDTNDDGVADKRIEIVNTFGFSGNAASVHGCFLGPTGRIYWCDGRHGHEFKNEKGELFSKGKAARIFSCRPNGDGVQVFCGGGMDNPVEVDFTNEGEMFGTVNILLGRPREDCLMHWVEGGVYPRYDQETCVAEFKSTGELLQPMTKLGHVAVSGMTRYRSDHFGPEYRGNVFTAIFNTHKVVRSIVERVGSTFRTREEDFLVSDNPDFHPTDVLEDADGSLLVIDTGGWFRIGCPASKVAKPEIAGAIYRIRRKGRPPAKDPRGIKLKLEQRSPAQLARLLDDSRPAVQERALDLMAQRGLNSADVLHKVLTGTGKNRRSVVARRNAVWALSRISHSGSPGPIKFALSDESMSVRLSAIHAVGANRDAFAVDQLCRFMVDGQPAESRAAATALGRICESEQTREWGLKIAAGLPDRIALERDARQNAIEALFAGLQKSGSDRVLEHAIIFALIRIGQSEAIARHLKDSNPHVRRAALIALDQIDGKFLERQMVTPLLDTDDPALRATVLDVIARHDGWAKETVQQLAAWLREKRLTDQQKNALRGFLIAKSREPEIQKLINRSLLSTTLDGHLRLLLLEVVERSQLESLPRIWAEQTGRALADKDPAIQFQAIKIVDSQKLNVFDGRLVAIADDSQAPPQNRIEAIIAAAPRLKGLKSHQFQFLLSELQSREVELDRLTVARALSAVRLNDSQLVKLASVLDESGPLAIPLLVSAFANSQSDAVGTKLVTALLTPAAGSSLTSSDLKQVLKGYSDSVRFRATPLLRRLEVGSEEARKKIANLSTELQDGDPVQGRLVFFGRTAACASCHAITGQGGRVGPDLSKIGAIRTRRDLLEALILPSSTFARGYRSYVVATDDGRVQTGVISRRTVDAITLRTAQLAEIHVLRKSIEQIKESTTSIMPKGLDERLSRDELRDLLAFLRSLK